MCHNLNLVEIRDANLVCLKYEGSRINFLLENVPLLVEIFIGGMLTSHMEDVLLMLSSYLPQLEILTIRKMDAPFSWEETEMFYSAVKMTNLKQLVVKVPVVFDDSLLQITNLIRASPCLQRFVLKAFNYEPEIEKRRVEKIARSYAHLKEVEFVGYSSITSNVELVMHLVENAVELEKILVDPCEPCETPFHCMWKNHPEVKDGIVREEMDARARAKKQLKKIVPPRIKLEIL